MNDLQKAVAQLQEENHTGDAAIIVATLVQLAAAMSTAPDYSQAPLAREMRAQLARLRELTPAPREETVYDRIMNRMYEKGETA